MQLVLRWPTGAKRDSTTKRATISQKNGCRDENDTKSKQHKHKSEHSANMDRVHVKTTLQENKHT